MKKRKLELGTGYPERRLVVCIALNNGYFLSPTEAAAIQLCLEEHGLDNNQPGKRLKYVENTVHLLKRERPHRTFFNVPE